MIARTILRALSKIRLFDLDWYDELKDIAEAAQRQRIEDEALILTDPHDMSRWMREPVGRRKRPHVNARRRP